jgi:hypothetical protein
MSGWLLIAARAAAGEEVEVRSISGAIAVDGALTEPEWASVRPVTQLLRYDPTPGGEPPGRTEFRFLQDDQHLYVGVRVTEPGYPVRARLSAREAIDEDEIIGIALDTFHDGRTGSVFRVNPIGVQQDLRYVSGEYNLEWNAAFLSEGRLTDGGYEIELAIPWRSLKYAAGGERQTWGVILTRAVPHEGATYAWPVLHVGTAALFSEEALLVGVQPPRAGSGLELVPAVTLTPAPRPDRRGPFDPRDYSTVPVALRPSFDLRYGLTPDLGLAATVNPDFSQIESDVADVRLNARFAYEFTELRPFFLDGAEYFDDLAGTLYSRSIGEPLYGTKVSGRRGGLSVGALHALDLSPPPSAHERGAPGFRARDVQGRWASTTVGRVKGNVLDSGHVGVTVSDKRVLGTPGAPGARGVNDTCALDASVPIQSWTFQGGLAESLVSDGQSGSRWGQRADLSVLRGSGRGLGVRLAGTHFTPWFRQEAGFVNQTGLVDSYAGLDYTFAPGQGNSTVRPYVEGSIFHELDGDNLWWAGTGQELVLAGVHTLWVNGELQRQQQSEVELDGWYTSGGYDGTFGPALGLSLEGEASQTLDFGTLRPAMQHSGTLTGVVRPTNALRTELTVTVSRHHPQARPVERARLVRGRVDWQLSRALGVRALLQEDRLDEAEGTSQHVLGSLLLGWLRVPGTAAFVGWTEQRSLSSRARPERLVFAKLSVLVRP